MNHRKIRNTLVCVLLLGAGTMNAWAQSLMIYPAAGQSPQQQQQDQYNCHGWSVQQSGYDPSNPPAPSSGPSFGSASKEVLKGGLRGAAAGAAIGAIAGDAGKGAAIGAVGGGMRRGFQERDRQQQAASAPPPGLDNYNRAMKSCLGALGYSVN
ncbi:glycine zipper family protein [Methylomonas sp. MO1]|uniref:glycine zipper family protein n=1 Tax=Methylomonas sp. MO1 TaxID=3073619 RepID=UPI0028A2DFB2|nr:glycine zipper family protein [Methylomonas sp. MO1]MDT4290353.1 glycine zipper family protein [Methylomonas sp. MO1]